jgi:glycosyltransferase involved in cell wall biosynthesis
MNGVVPSASIVIPCYQQGHYLRGCIESALAQGEGAVEVIVVNDGSTDTTDAVAREFEGRIGYLQQANRGLSAARNRGVSAARGEWIQFLDADDLLEPGKTAFQAAAGVAAGADVVYGPYECFRDDRAQDRFRSQPVEFPEPDAFRSFIRHWERGFGIPIHALLYRRDCFARWGGFNERLPNHEDWDRHLQFSAAGARFVYVGGPHALYRLTGQSMSRGPAAEHAMRTGKFQCLAGLLATGQLSREQRTLVLQRYLQEREAEILAALRGRRWGRAARLCRTPAVDRLPLRARLVVEYELWRRLVRRCSGAALRRLMPRTRTMESVTS